MGDIIPFRSAGAHPPQSFRGLLEQRVPAYVNRLLIQGGPQAADYEQARAFTATIGPCGDDMQFLLEPGTKRQKEATSNLEDMARHVATLAFVPGGIRLFGLYMQVIDGNLSIEATEGTAGAFLHPSTRKTTGSYYTPRSLIDCLLDTALEPVMDEAIARSSHPRIQANARRGILINLARRIEQAKEETEQP